MLFRGRLTVYKCHNLYALLVSIHLARVMAGDMRIAKGTKVVLQTSTNSNAPCSIIKPTQSLSIKGTGDATEPMFQF